jgi:hypothetical protein
VIHYALVCEADHEFEGWFRSSDDFEAQVARGLVACPACGATKVARALMAPAVSTSRKRAAIAASAPSEAAAGGGAANVPPDAAGGDAVSPAPPVPAERMAVAMADPRAAMMIEMLRRLRRHVEETAENVGGRFPEEARKIHYGEAEARGIYGEASPDDVEALLEEGVEIHPLPVLPEERN